MKSGQLNFYKSVVFKDYLPRFEHGGGLRKGKRKLSRPIDSRNTLHIAMRSTKAKGPWSLLKSCHEKQIRKLVYSYAARFNVRIFRFANLRNHLHILLKPSSKNGFQNYLRTILEESQELSWGLRGEGLKESSGRIWHIQRLLDGENNLLILLTISLRILWRPLESYLLEVRPEDK